MSMSSLGGSSFGSYMGSMANLNKEQDNDSASQSDIGGFGTDIQENYMIEDVKRELEYDAAQEEQNIPPRSPLHGFVRTIVNSMFFNFFIFLAIFANIIVIVMEANSDFYHQHVTGIDICNSIFIGIYTVELVLKLFVEPKEYWKDGFNIFDFAILMSSYLNIIMSFFQTSGISSLSYLRLFRTLRALRAMKAVPFIQGLEVLVKAIFKAFLGVLNIMILIMLFNYVFAIMSFYFFASEDSEHYGNLFHSFTTMFAFTTAEGWRDIQSVTDQTNSSSMSKLVTISFIFIGNFVLKNLFVGVVMQYLDDATLEHNAVLFLKKQAVISRKKGKLIKHQELQFEMITKQLNAKNDITYEDMLKQIHSGLRHEDVILVKGLTTDRYWIEAYMCGLDIREDTLFQQQMLHYELTNTLCTLAERQLARQHLSMYS
ncbi:cation channel sperm-associated protein 3-like protein [Aduncisulcus paluster]|uniref:Cation channel sperm-associated protein 3-like protein n=1 Tax=Aduncisulcus paluster TaxID=2918883 RepID=A0ABQ5KBD3_9EUKA|nr:cation channel sperm-associated protein 3-like protein [Aduncisulcus paluster]